MRKIYAFIIACCAMVSISVHAQEKLIILNEGTWQSDNGRMSYFEDGKIVSNKWFENVNGSKLGDTPNDIIQVNDTLIAIAVNWSNIIQFIRPNGKAVAATENVPNNRKLASDGRYVYVTSYAHECTVNGEKKEFTKGYVAKIDAKDFKVVAATEVGYEPEGIALYNGHLFVANSGGYAYTGDHNYESTVSILDAETMTVTKTVDTKAMNLYGVMSQAGQYLCINSAGDYYNNPACSVIFDCQKALDGNDDCFVKLSSPATYNTVTTDGKFFVVGSSFSYTTSQNEITCLTVDPSKAIASAGNEGVDKSLPGTVEATIKKMQNPYGIYVNPYTGFIYATDAASYASAGKLYQFDKDGNTKGSYDVYINPGHFLALPPDGMSTSITNKKARTANQVIFDLDGRRLSAPQRGINIIRYADGTTKKVLR